MHRRRLNPWVYNKAHAAVTWALAIAIGVTIAAGFLIVVLLLVLAWRAV